MKITVGSLRKLIRESVVDASARFRAKRSSDLSSKVSGVASDLPGAFAKQGEQERWFNTELEDLKLIPEDYVSKNRMRIACPIAFDEDEGWNFENTTIFDVIGNASSRVNPREWDQLSKFVRDNRDGFTRSSEEVRTRMGELEGEASEMDWPAPWKRYTKWNEVSSAMMRYLKNVDEMLG